LAGVAVAAQIVHGQGRAALADGAVVIGTRIDRSSVRQMATGDTRDALLRRAVERNWATLVDRMWCSSAGRDEGDVHPVVA
jgi:hypothetical protein